jgi:hypothetical protein
MRLDEYLVDFYARPFRYGEHDCALFAAGWVKARTGRDLAAGIKYTSCKEGLRALRGLGFRRPADMAEAFLQEIPVAHARAGDLAVISGALGIVAGERIAVLRAEGLGWMTLLDADRAFRVEG